LAQSIELHESSGDFTGGRIFAGPVKDPRFDAFLLQCVDCFFDMACRHDAGVGHQQSALAADSSRLFTDTKDRIGPGDHPSFQFKIKRQHGSFVLRRVFGSASESKPEA